MNIKEYYIEAQSGNSAKNQEIVPYIKSFSNIVLWGASYLGQKLAKYLRSVEILDHHFTTF